MSKINIVLYEPEIALNTANVMRTCVGLDATLHLIKPYGFDINLSDKVFKRGSTNYANLVDIVEYETFKDFESKNNSDDFCFITRYGEQIYSEIQIEDHKENIYYIFGKESAGIDSSILKKYRNQCYRIPIKKEMRSLNLGNCVMMIAFDGARQQGFIGLENKETHKKIF